jgi:hypothetical protein
MNSQIPKMNTPALIDHRKSKYPFSFYINNKPKAYLPGKYKEILQLVKASEISRNVKSENITSPEETKNIFEAIDYYYAKQAKENFEANLRSHKIDMTHVKTLKQRTLNNKFENQEASIKLSQHMNGHDLIADQQNKTFFQTRKGSCCKNPDLALLKTSHKELIAIPSRPDMSLNYSMTSENQDGTRNKPHLTKDNSLVTTEAPYSKDNPQVNLPNNKIPSVSKEISNLKNGYYLRNTKDSLLIRIHEKWTQSKNSIGNEQRGCDINRKGKVSATYILKKNQKGIFRIGK